MVQLNQEIWSILFIFRINKIFITWVGNFLRLIYEFVFVLFYDIRLDILQMIFSLENNPFLRTLFPWKIIFLKFLNDGIIEGKMEEDWKMQSILNFEECLFLNFVILVKVMVIGRVDRIAEELWEWFWLHIVKVVWDLWCIFPWGKGQAFCVLCISISRILEGICVELIKPNSLLLYMTIIIRIFNGQVFVFHEVSEKFDWLPISTTFHFENSWLFSFLRYR